MRMLSIKPGHNFGQNVKHLQLGTTCLLVMNVGEGGLILLVEAFSLFQTGTKNNSQ